MQYRFHDKRWEAPSRWYDNGSGHPETDKAIQQVIQGTAFDAMSVMLTFEDGSAIEYRLEPENLENPLDRYR